ncbi:MAG: hypothetical protein JO122_08555, partial [Acetobacteraceae bacterium]|nr:hypothetical protein [Acetobacteraceae bacterium]
GIVALAGFVALGGASGFAAQVADALATLLRIKTQDGTLLVEFDDPSVHVRVDGEDVVLTGDGIQELRVHPGEHQVKAEKDGRPLLEELITVERNGKRLVRISREAVPAPPPAGAMAGSGRTPGQQYPAQPDTLPAPYGAQAPGLNTPTAPGLAPYPQPRVMEPPAPPSSAPLALPGAAPAMPAVPVPTPGLAPQPATMPAPAAVLVPASPSPPGGAPPTTAAPVLPLPPGGAPAPIAPPVLPSAPGAAPEPAVMPVPRPAAAPAPTAAPPTGTLPRPAAAGEPHPPDPFVARAPAGARARRSKTRTGAPDEGLVRRFDGHHGRIFALAFTPDGQRIISGGVDGTLRTWDVASGRCLTVIQAHPGGVASLAISADGRYVLTGGLEGVARLWDLGTCASVKTFSHNAHAIVAVALSPDGRLALTGGGGAYGNGDFPVEGGDFDIRLWDVGTGKIMRRMSGHTHWVHGLAFSPDGKSAASASLDATVRVWSVADGSERHCFDCGAPGWSVAFLPDNRLVATADDVVLWNLKKVKLLSCLHTGTSPTGVGGVAVVPQSPFVVTGGNDGFVHVWNVESLREACRFQGHDGSVGTVSAAPGGMFVVSAGNDGSIRLWSLEGSPLSAEGRTARPGTASIPVGAVETSPTAVPAGP